MGHWFKSPHAKLGLQSYGYKEIRCTKLANVQVTRTVYFLKNWKYWVKVSKQQTVFVVIFLYVAKFLTKAPKFKSSKFLFWFVFLCNSAMVSVLQQNRRCPNVKGIFQRSLLKSERKWIHQKRESWIYPTKF